MLLANYLKKSKKIQKSSDEIAETDGFSSFRWSLDEKLSISDFCEKRTSGNPEQCWSHFKLHLNAGVTSEGNTFIQHIANLRFDKNNVMLLFQTFRHSGKNWIWWQQLSWGCIITPLPRSHFPRWHIRMTSYLNHIRGCLKDRFLISLVDHHECEIESSKIPWIVISLYFAAYRNTKGYFYCFSKVAQTNLSRVNEHRLTNVTL